MKKPKQNIAYFIISNFNYCFFTSILILTFCGKILTGSGLPFYSLFFINAGLSVLATYIIYHFTSRRPYLKEREPRHRTQLLWLSAATGALTVSVATSPIFAYVFTIIITALTIKSIRKFAVKMANLLEYRTVASRQNVADFLNFFINLILTFTVINLSLYLISVNLDTFKAFDFGSGINTIINALYFTIVTLTTTGFGDMVPTSGFAKIIVSLECLISYIMFALMIGIISRGVDFQDKKSPKRKTKK